MRYGIFADIHGNFEGFKAVLDILSLEDIDEAFCCGDIVGYGASPKECLGEIEKREIICVAGNHDWAVAGRQDIENFNPLAKIAIEWTQTLLTENEKKFLGHLPLTHAEKDFVLVHGTLHQPAQFHYMRDSYEAARSFIIMERPVCFVGHSHAAGIWVEENDSFHRLEDFEVRMQKECRYIINVGSVGQPRDSDARAAYCIFDIDKRTISIKRVDYDVKGAQDKILNAGLPEGLATRLSVGQ